MSGRITDFTRVDATGDPAFFIEFLDLANGLATTQEAKRKMEAELRLVPGAAVLEVGVGTGDDAIRLSQLGAAVSAIDISSVMVEEALRRTRAAGLELDIRLASVTALPFPDATFDAVRVERVLMYVADVSRAISELVRVTKPGGRIVIFDFDWEDTVVRSNLPEVTRRILDYFRRTIPSPHLGREFAVLFETAGLGEASVEPHRLVSVPPVFRRIFAGVVPDAEAAGVILTEEGDAWWNDLQRLEATGEFYASFPGYLASATKH